MTGRMLIPFAGRNATGVYGQNLLWADGPLYVMDNHRAAAWCWAQHLDAGTEHVLIHIDRHNDTLQSQLGTWLGLLPAGIPAGIDAYLGLRQPLGLGDMTAPLFRWDNYLSIYLALHQQTVREAFFATWGEGDRPNHGHVTTVSPEGLLSLLETWSSRVSLPAILNIDLDYFFGPDGDENALRVLDDAYFDRLVGAIAALDRAGAFRVITIALTATDDLTGGWAPAEALAARLTHALGRPFLLPADPEADPR